MLKDGIGNDIGWIADLPTGPLLFREGIQIGWINNDSKMVVCPSQLRLGNDFAPWADQLIAVFRKR